MRGSTRVSALALWLAVFGASGLVADEFSDMRARLQDEVRLLDVEIEEYGKARDRERADLATLVRLNARFDATIADPNAARAELVRLERQIDAARETAIESTRQCAAARRLMFEQMRKVADLIRDFEHEGIALTPAGGSVRGTWRLEATPNNVTGLLTLVPDGTLVTGSYRLSNGRSGSVSGNLVGEGIVLELYDSVDGHVGRIEGELDLGRGEITGSWQAMALTEGRPTAGRWTATRVTSKNAWER